MLLFISVRQIIVILGVILLLRIIGKVMLARKTMQENDAFKSQEKAKQMAKQNYGKTTISKINKSQIKDSDYTEFEEVD